MHIKSIVAGAAIALTAMVSPAVADGETGLKEVQGFSVLSRVSADRLTDQEMSGLQGAGTFSIQFPGISPMVGLIRVLSLGDAVTAHICASTNCILAGIGGPVSSPGI